MRARNLLLGFALTTAGFAGTVHAQANDGPPDFAEMRQRMMNRMKQMIGVNDDEWKAMQPKIEKIQQLQRDVNLRGMGMGGPGGPGGGGPGGQGGPGGGVAGPGGPPPGFGGGPDNGKPSEVQQNLRDLREALQNSDAAADDIKARADAYRAAREKAKDNLKAAQDDLKQSTINAHAEAALLALGILE